MSYHNGAQQAEEAHAHLCLPGYLTATAHGNPTPPATCSLDRADRGAARESRIPASAESCTASSDARKDPGEAA